MKNKQGCLRDKSKRKTKRTVFTNERPKVAEWDVEVTNCQHFHNVRRVTKRVFLCGWRGPLRWQLLWEPRRGGDSSRDQRKRGLGVVTDRLWAPTSPDHTMIKPKGEKECVCEREVCGSRSALKPVVQTTSSVSHLAPSCSCVYL